MTRLNANLAAIEVVQALRAVSRAATPAEQEILAGWSGWGAVAAVFEEKPGEDRAFTQGRQQLRALLTDKEYAAARRNTVNAHYTGTALARAMWSGLAAFGFSGGRVLEPGCGSGNFIGLAPLGTAMAGIELDPVSAHVAAALYPHAQIRNESFADTQLPEGSFDAAIGNVPFGKIHLNDSRYNPGRRYPIHTHFVLKSVALVRPGGWIALITSRYTLDGTGEDAVAARRQLAGFGELAAAVRLPAAAHRRTAGTDVVTDVLVFRRFGDGEQPPPGEPAWIQTVPVDVGGVQIPVNRYFADHPGMVLGELAAGGARRADDLQVIAPAGTDVATGLAQALAGAAAGRAAPAPRPAAPAPVVDRPPEGYQQARPDGTFARITSKFFEPFDPPGGPAGQAELRALLGMRDAAMALLDAELATTEDSGLVDDLRADLNARYDAYVAAYGPVNRHTRQVKIRNTPEGRTLRDQLLAEGDARFTGGKLEISDPAVRDQLVAAGHATVTGTGELRFGRTREARAERQRLLDSGQARTQGGTLTLTETGRTRVLENAADLQDAVTIIRVRPSQGGFRNDPFAVRVLALEKYDPETGMARKNDIMRHRVLLPRPDVEHAEDPEDALAICMDRHARVRLNVIAALLGAASEQDARDRLGTLVYHDPAEGRLVPAQEYLSGDVRVKLHQAAVAAAADPACQANVEALTKVIPPDLGPAEIEARLGAVFITPAEVQQFLRETLADASVTVALAANGTWSVRGGDRHSVAATITWGTADRDALSLAEHLLNRKGPVEVTRKDAEGRTWTDEEATAAAREKQAELSDRFAGWAWEDLDRAGEICRRYNDAFNSIVLRSYDEVQLSLPGVNRDISLFWWQKAAIARMIYEPTAGLFHDMGAGKTLEQIIGVMEQKRLGLIRKPVICVKNHLLDQFRDEFLWAYPQARILCADTSDLEGEGRRQFIARCAAENPDAIIMTRGAFESIPLTPEGHEAYLDYMKQMFAVHAEVVTESVKDEETLLAEFEEKLRAYFDPDYQKDEDEDENEPDRKRRKRKVEQDPAMCWEQMGIDYACIDESQDFNNLWVPSDEPGMAIGFTHRAIDLEMKLHAIRRRYGSRAGALATGTPVTNKIAQFYVLQRYLRPERLQAAGFAGYAPWAATYTEPEQRLEMKADGRFGMVTRMRLINFPELLLDLHFFGDFKDADDIGLPRPAIRGGKPEIRGNPAVTELVDYQSTLPERYHKAKGGKKHKGDDTVVAVIGDGFRAAQDLRLVKANHGERPSLTDEPQKIDHIADDVYAEWLARRDDVYPGEDGQPDPVTGSLQLVFCNEGVPSGDWNLYDELRNLLIERGMPRAAIRFIHDATDARKKAALFAACNAGHVAVLIGSTEKMGVGTNVQRRCIGVHHLHPHWRPDYDAQEDARARRPGNLNTEVFIKKWITEGSFDTIRAQACERKSVFLRVIKHRDTSVRSIEAPGDDTVSYAEIAAVGAGEPRLIQKAQLESELQQLARAQRRHLNNQNALKVAEQQARASITAAEQTIRDIDAAAARLIPTSGDAFSMTVDETTFTARREAGDHLITCLRDVRARVPAGECHTRTVGTIGGFQLAADLAHDGREDSIVLRLADLPGGVVRLDHRKLPGGIGLVTRLENRLTSLDKLRLEQQAILDHQRQEITRAQAAIGTPFPQQDALLAAKKALDDLVTELRNDKNNKDGAKADPTTAAAGPAGPRHDDNRDIRPAAGTRPARIGGPDSATGRSGSPPGDRVLYGEESAALAARQPGTADTSMQASGSSGVAVRDTSLGRDLGAALAVRAAANSTAPAPERPADQDHGAAPEPADDPAAGLVIEHHQQGTLVHGTEKNDQELRRLLRKQGFRWSGNLNAWYLPRPWTLSTRDRRVTGLTASLRQARRSFTMRSQQPAPGAGADDSPPEPVPAGEPYTDLRQAQDDHSAAVYDYWELTRTPAGNNVMSTRQPGARPDAVALDAAYHAVHVSWQQAFAGDPHEVADRFTAWTQAASALSRNLAAEQHRAPKFRQTLDTFIRSAARLASRAQATSEDPAAWARVFAGIPGDVPDTPPEAVTPDRAQPAADSPEPGAAPAGNQQGGRDSDEPGDTSAPAADDDTAAPSAARPVDAAPALPAACRIAADLRQLAAAYGLSIDTESTGARGTQLTVVHDDGRTVLLHDDISGTSAGGYRLDPGEVPAYLAAYARHPQLPSRCLADLVRQDPGAPGSLTLAGAREIAARHDLEIRIRRARGQAYITFCEPGTAGPPVLSYPAGTGTACHGPCTVPVAAINGYLLTYRVSVPAVMFTAPAAAPQDWARRVAQLTPHLVDGGGYFIRDTRDHLRAALTAARDGHTDEASRLLGQAETVTPPLTPAPERQAELLAVIGEQAARNGRTDDPAGYMARAMPPFLDASDREWDWVRIYIADHPDVFERTGRDGPVADAGQPDDSRQVAVGKSRQAKTALENGDYEQALALLDEAELLYPDHGISWEAARDQVRGAMRQATSTRPQDQDSLRAGVQAPAGSVAEAPATSAARPSAPASPADGISGDAGTAAAPDVAGAAQPHRWGRYSSRIRIGTATGTTVSGTSDLDDPPELREALLANGFTWREQRRAWVHAGGDIGPLEAVAAIRDLLARLDHGQDPQPAAAPRSSPAPETGTGASAGQGAGVAGAAPGAAALSPPSAESPPVPATNSDLARALHHLHGWEFVQFISQVQEPGRAESRTGRHDGDPGAGARENVDWDASGLRVTISGSGIRRYSQLSWPQIEHWIDAGMTPARLGLIVTASQLRSFCRSHRQELIAAGRCDPDAAASELAQIRDDAISTVIAAALRTRGAAAPVPPARPGTPAYHTAAMITRPDPDAGKDENTALERLARLRAAVADPQPVTAAEVRAAIRRWIGDRLPDHVRVLGSPAKMHAWIDDQVTDRAGRPAPVTYDHPGAPGGRWYSASPEGLLTGTGGDGRAETLIRWEEIPAWTQPGITTSLRDRLLSADDACREGFRRRLTAVAHPHSGVAAPSDQEDEQSARQLREAIAAAWAAIDAAPSPGPAQLEQARRTYRDTSPVQETLFTGTEPAQQHDDASRTAGQAAAGARRQAQHPPAQAPPPQPGTPLTDDDICLGLRRLPPLVFAELLGVTGTGRPMDPATRQLAPYSGERAAGEPGSGARETVTASSAGVHIQVDAADGTRAGLLTWPEAARWVQHGLTPARRRIIERATRNGLRFAMAHASFRGIGEAALAAGAEQELRSLAVGAVTAMLEDARAARTGQPHPGSQPGHGDGEAAALERISDLATALPTRPPQPRTTVWQVKAGDIIGHPGYRLQPFLVSAPPRDRAGQIEITGRLTDPADGEPAGQIILTLIRAGHPDPVVYLVPPPARSLRSLHGGTTTTEEHTDQDHTRADDDSPSDIAQPAARHGQPPATASRPHADPAGTPATGSTATPGMTPGTATPDPSRVNGTGQPPSIEPLIQEDTMPPAISATSLPPEGTAPADRPAPAVGPAPAAWKLVAHPGAASQARPGSQSADDMRLLHELDHVLAAITERRRAAAAPPGTDGTSLADIRAAFTVLRHALDLPGPASNGDGARQGAAVPDAGQSASPPPGAAQDGAAAAHGDFSDIRAAFASLRDVLGLPAPGGHALPAAPRPDVPAGPDAGRLLDQAAAEAHACARWYRETPEWQRMSRIGRAARELLTAIREAAGDYWTEIRLDIRVRGFARTLAARVSLAVSGTSHLLAGRLERAGHRNTRPWRAAWRLHQATATFANRVMNYAPPASPARMDDARRIIDDLGHGARHPGGPEPSRAASPPGRETRTPGAVALGRECFPVLVSRANTRPDAAPAARTPAPPPPHQAPAAARR